LLFLLFLSAELSEVAQKMTTKIQEISQFQPGMLVRCKVLTTLGGGDGLALTFCNAFGGTVNWAHLPSIVPRDQLQDIYPKGKTVTGRILFVGVGTDKSIGISLKPNLVSLTPYTSAYSLGYIFKTTKTTKTTITTTTTKTTRTTRRVKAKMKRWSRKRGRHVRKFLAWWRRSVYPSSFLMGKRDSFRFSKYPRKKV